MNKLSGIKHEWISGAMAVLMMVCFTLGGTGCATTEPREAIAVDSDQQKFRDIDVITMLPSVALINIEEETLNQVHNATRGFVAQRLAVRGYVMESAETFSDTLDLDHQDVGAMSRSELTSLGPANSRYILITFLNSVETSSGILSQSGEVNVSAILADKSTGQILWEDEAQSKAVSSLFSVSPSGLGAIGNLIMMAATREDFEALTMSIRSLFETFPDKND